MLRLADVTGQQIAIERILERQTSLQKECVIISGVIGAGVSWALTEVGVEWERRGGRALKASGAALAVSRQLFPWLMMRSPCQTNLARAEIMKSGAAELAKAIPIVGEAASYVVDIVLNYRRKRIAQQTQMLSEKEQDILYVIEGAASNKRLLLIVDQIATWDDDSWSLLELIMSSSLDGIYPSLANVLILIGSDEVSLVRCQRLAQKLPLHEFIIHRLHRVDLSTALAAFEFPHLEQFEIDLLHEATGGRLDLLHDFAVLAREVGWKNPGGDAALFYGKLIERRLRALKGDINALEGLLKAAAFIGRSSSKNEISCLTGCDGDKLSDILNWAEGENLIKTSDDTITFPSIAMRDYFRSSQIGNERAYHQKFADCLRKLRPGDYQARSRHLLLAGQIEAAEICFCLATLDAHRQRSPVSNPSAMHESAHWKSFGEYLGLMTKAYMALAHDKIEDGLTILQTIESILPDPLLAERDYLEAQLRLKSYRLADFERAVIVLNRWRNFQTIEGELWSRIAQTLFIALAETQRYAEAREIEETLTRFYAARKNLDPWALFGLNVLRRRSECLYHLIPARNRLLSSIEYFGPATMGGLPRHPIQYYYALTNLVSNLIASGDFSGAYTRGEELQSLLKTRAANYWPALENAANNLILAGYLANVLSLADATTLISQIDEDADDLGDRILIKNNHAVLLILGGNIIDAKKIFSDAYSKLAANTQVDGYHRYFVANNLAALTAMENNVSDALNIMHEASNCLSAMLPSIRETLIRRHNLILNKLPDAYKLTATTYDCLLSKENLPQVGPQWAFFGRGFLLSDIQFWGLE